MLKRNLGVIVISVVVSLAVTTVAYGAFYTLTRPVPATADIAASIELDPHLLGVYEDADCTVSLDSFNFQTSPGFSDSVIFYLKNETAGGGEPVTLYVKVRDDFVDGSVSMSGLAPNEALAPGDSVPVTMELRVNPGVAFGDRSFTITFDCQSQAWPPPHITPITWIMASSWGPGSVFQYSADLFANMVTEASDGRLKIVSHPAGAIVPAVEVFDAVNAGVIDVGHTITVFRPDAPPAAPLFWGVPGGMTAPEYWVWLYEGGGLALWQEMYSGYNIGFVGPGGITGPASFAWSRVPLDELADFEGLRIRSVGLAGKVLNALGAKLVVLPAGEIYTAMEIGMIDAAEFSIPSLDLHFGFHEVAPYLIQPGLLEPSSLLELLINKDSWNALPADLQKIVQRSAEAATLMGWAHSQIQDAQAIEVFKAYGTTIVELPQGVQVAIRAEANALLDAKALDDAFFAEVLASQRAFLEVYRPYEELLTPSD